jgi:release factor glutamine methyltransferase
VTITEILKKSYKKLSKTTKNPTFEAEFLLSHILGKSREFIIAHPEKKLTGAQIIKYNKLISRRAKGEPIAYLVGYKHFYGNKFLVNKNVLVPRPETELMVDSIFNLQSSISNSIFIDVGTGAGCVIVSVAKEIKNLKFFGTDISDKALAVAKKNAKLNHLDKNIIFLQGNLLEPILKNKKFIIRNSKFVICANLPYLTPAQVKKSPTIKHEPKLALEAGRDGLKYYRQLFKQIKKLKSLCVVSYVLCEIDDSQASTFAKMLFRIFPLAKLEIKHDLAKKRRLAIITLFNG